MLNHISHQLVYQEAAELAITLPIALLTECFTLGRSYVIDDDKRTDSGPCEAWTPVLAPSLYKAVMTPLHRFLPPTCLDDAGSTDA